MISLWLTPLLLLALPAQVMAHGREGLWIGLAIVSGPLLFYTLRTSLVSSAEDLLALPFARLALMSGATIHLWANLGLLGELVGEWGLPRWSGIIAGALLLLSGSQWSATSRVATAWMGMVLVTLFVPLGAIMWKTDSNPIEVFHETASRIAFRFEAESAWVREGRSLPTSGQKEWVEFLEEHHLTMASGGVVRLAYSDGSGRLIEERSFSNDEELVVRPGDWLQPEAGVRIRFEPGKRIPRAPLNGSEWASALAFSGGRTLTGQLGLALTLFGGAMAWPSFFLPRSWRMNRLQRLLAGSGLFLIALWGECWGVYAARFAPELFLDGVRASSILYLPTFVLGGGAGRWLVALVVVGVLMTFLASAAFLGRALAAGFGERRPLFLTVMAGIGAGAAVLPTPSWELALLGFGLGTVTLAPLLLVGPRLRWANAIVGVALFAYMIVAVIARTPLGAVLPDSVLRFPVLGVLPLVIVLLAVARRRGRAPERSPERSHDH